MNQIDLAGRAVVITGGARGIGYAVAQRALASGAEVALWDIDAERLERARGELAKAGKVGVAVVELTEEASVEKATQQTLEAHRKIDVLINSARITGGNGTTWELAPDVWRRVIDVNLIGPYLTCRAVVPHMLKEGYGRIVNIASVAGKEGHPNASHYSASKAGLIGRTQSLGQGLATRRILVNTGTPGTDTREILDML